MYNFGNYLNTLYELKKEDQQRDSSSLSPILCFSSYKINICNVLSCNLFWYFNIYFELPGFRCLKIFAWLQREPRRGPLIKLTVK